MKVVDASVLVGALTGSVAARQALATEDLFAPPLIDLEVVQVLRRLVSAGRLEPEQGAAALTVLRTFGLTRYPVHGLTGRIWGLRDNLTAYDAAYVAVAEALDCPLLTADRKLAGAPGLRCSVMVVPS